MKAIVTAVEMAGGKAWTEPRFQIHHSDDEHTDIRVALGPHVLYLDVTVVHPTASSYAHAAAGAALKTAASAEKNKNRQYRQRAIQERAKFVPLSWKYTADLATRHANSLSKSLSLPALAQHYGPLPISVALSNAGG